MEYSVARAHLTCTAECGIELECFVCVCAAAVVQHTLNCKVPLSVVRFLFPVEHNLQTEKGDIARALMSLIKQSR